MIRGVLVRLLAATVVLGCAAATPPAQAPDREGSEPGQPPMLHRPLDQYAFQRNPELLQRLADSPYGYFRFTNIGFSEQVCRRFEDLLQIMPVVNLHGDAHLENYAVTSLGRGLVDYDDASSGPAVMDLIRFAVSMRVLARLRGWDASPAEAALFEGYRQALKDPSVEVPVPACARRVEAAAGTDRSEFLTYAESLMRPVPAESQASFEDGFGRYAALIRDTHAGLPEYFFDIVRSGYLNIGYGSALNVKFLIRIQGLTKDAGDDLILEAKEVRDLSDISCISTPTGTGAFRILLSQTRIGNQPSFLMAEVPRRRGDPADNPLFWVQPWHDHYRELDAETTLASAQEMTEVARDVGAQLGRGHVARIASPFDGHLRRAQLQVLDEFHGRIRASIQELTALTFQSWQSFREQAALRSRTPATP